MDQEKLDKAIEIILHNQAQFYADLQQTQEAQKSSEKRIAILEKVSANLIEVVKETNESVRQVSKNVDKLSKNVDELRSAQKETNEKLRETDERLNAVIYMAERFFGGQNGKFK